MKVGELVAEQSVAIRGLVVHVGRCANDETVEVKLVAGLNVVVASTFVDKETDAEDAVREVLRRAVGG